MKNTVIIKNTPLLKKFLAEENRNSEVVQDGWALSVPITSNEDAFNLGARFMQFCNRLENRLITIGELEELGLITSL
jgi:hypothetical protein